MRLRCIKIDSLALLYNPECPWQNFLLISWQSHKFRIYMVIASVYTWQSPKYLWAAPLVPDNFLWA
jgi:hypothetical protein